jgi:hypothetical protein
MASKRPGPQLVQHLLDRRLVDAEQIGEGLEVWSERQDEADVEVAIGPAVQPLADAGRKGIVDLRVAQRALRAERLDLPDWSNCRSGPPPRST